jgi:prophage DNA circulation protein
MIRSSRTWAAHPAVSASWPVIGPIWEASRDTLIFACEDSDQEGTLVHPYLGSLRVRCIEFEVSEETANFELTFVEAGETMHCDSVARFGYNLIKASRPCA